MSSSVLLGGVSLGCFGFVGLVLRSLTFGTPYYVNHVYISFLLFVLGSAGHHVLVHRFKVTSGSFLMGFATGTIFYLSRELRDRQKLGSWDWPGLWAPVVALCLLFATCEVISRLVRVSCEGGSLTVTISNPEASGADR